MRAVLVRVLTTLVLIGVGAGATLGIAYWVMAQRFVAGDAHALDGIVRVPVNEPMVFRDVTVWDGRGGPVRSGRSVVVRDGRIERILGPTDPLPADLHHIDASGKTLIPGLIDAHVHLMYDSGPDLLTRAPQLMDEWLAIVRQYPESRAPIVRRGQLKLKAGVTTMRVVGDGYYSLAYRDDLARWDVVEHAASAPPLASADAAGRQCALAQAHDGAVAFGLERILHGNRPRLATDRPDHTQVAAGIHQHGTEWCQRGRHVIDRPPLGDAAEIEGHPGG